MEGGIKTRRCRPIGLEKDRKSDLSLWMTIGHRGNAESQLTALRRRATSDIANDQPD